MLPKPKEEESRVSSPIVQIKVEHELQGAIFTCKESTKKVGEVFFLEISGFVPTISDSIEVVIQPSTPKELFGSTIKKSHKSDEEGNSFNTALREEGVFMHNPKDKHRIYAISMFSPVKVSFASVYAGIVWFFSTPPYSQIGYFTIFAFLEALLTIFPRVHSKEKSRFDTLYHRFLQWAGALFFGSSLLVMEKLADTANATGIGGYIAKGVFGWGMGFVISIYFFRLVGSAYKLFYAEKAEVVKKKTLSFFPKRIRKFLGDSDITG